MYTTNQISLSLSPDQLFAWIVDLDHLPLWQSGVFRSEVLTPPPTRIGTRFRETLRVFGMRWTAECEVVDVQPPRILVLAATGRQMRYTSRMEIAPTAGGSRLTMASSLSLRGLWRLLTPLVRMEAAREGAAELSRLKAAAEGDPEAAGLVPQQQLGPAR